MPNEIIPENPAPRTQSSVFDTTPVRIFALLLLLTTAPVYAAFSLTPLLNGEIWWHLSSGLWILQNHAFPRTGLFSQYADRAWVDTSWGFDVLTAGAYKLLGLRAFRCCSWVSSGVAAVTFLLARGGRGNFCGAVLLSAIAQYVIVDLLPLPILFSILFFAIELFLLLQSRRGSDMRILYLVALAFFRLGECGRTVLERTAFAGLVFAAEVAEFLLHSSGVRSFPAPAHSLAKVFAIAGAFGQSQLWLTPYTLQLFPKRVPD